MTKKIPEDELILLLRTGEQSSFTYLYENYSAAIYGLILRIVEDEEAAADVLQESFVKIWKNFSMYDSSKGRIFTWMINIARNLAIDKLRSKYFKQDSKNLNLDTSVSHIDRKLQTNFRPEHIGLKQLVQKMKPEFSVILNLIYFKGYTQAETAEELQIPLGTVKTRMRNAIIQLRELIK